MYQLLPLSLRVYALPVHNKLVNEDYEFQEMLTGKRPKGPPINNGVILDTDLFCKSF